MVGLRYDAGSMPRGKLGGRTGVTVTGPLLEHLSKDPEETRDMEQDKMQPTTPSDTFELIREATAMA